MEGISPELTAPPQPQTSSSSSAQYLFTPLIISMLCMLATFSAILTYHFIVVHYCLSRRHRQAMADLLARGNTPTPDSPIGVQEKVLRRIPIVSYTNINPQLQKECVVCLGEMEEGSPVRVLPNCRHVFHVACIDRWFLAHSTCPVCRSPLLPPPHDDPSPSMTELRSGLLRHAVSIVFPMEAEKLPRGRRGRRLRRSLSMDQSDVVINIIGSTSASSSSMLMEMSSFTQLRIHDGEAATVTVV